jgi:hypothetical protein
MPAEAGMVSAKQKNQKTNARRVGCAKAEFNMVTAD